MLNIYNRREKISRKKNSTNKLNRNNNNSKEKKPNCFSVSFCCCHRVEMTKHEIFAVRLSEQVTVKSQYVVYSLRDHGFAISRCATISNYTWNVPIHCVLWWESVHCTRAPPYTAHIIGSFAIWHIIIMIIILKSSSKNFGNRNVLNLPSVNYITSKYVEAQKLNWHWQ